MLNIGIVKQVSVCHEVYSSSIDLRLNNVRFPSVPWPALKHTFGPNLNKKPRNIACSELVAERD